MRKIPVFATIAKAYGFLGRELLTIIRLSWFLVLIAVAADYIATKYFYEAFLDLLRGRQEFESFVVGDLPFASGILRFVLTTMVAVGFHRVIILGERRLGQLIYVAFGKAELIFILLPILWGILAGGPILAWMGGFLYFNPEAIDASDESAGATVFAMVVVSFAWIAAAIFVGVRLCFALPIAAMEGRLALSRAWQLSRGNFWRLFWTAFLGMLPILVMLSIFQLFLGLPEFSENSDPNVVVTMFEHGLSNLPAMAVVNFVATILIGAVAVGLLCYSFKAVADAKLDDTAPVEGARE
jgi:hypothetical protein